VAFTFYISAAEAEPRAPHSLSSWAKQLLTLLPIVTPLYSVCPHLERSEFPRRHRNDTWQVTQASRVQSHCGVSARTPSIESRRVRQGHCCFKGALAFLLHQRKNNIKSSGFAWTTLPRRPASMNRVPGEFKCWAKDEKVDYRELSSWRRITSQNVGFKHAINALGTHRLKNSIQRISIRIKMCNSNNLWVATVVYTHYTTSRSIHDNNSKYSIRYQSNDKNR